MVHEAIVAQAYAKRHCLLPCLAVTLEWNKKGTVLGELTQGAEQQALCHP